MAYISHIIKFLFIQKPYINKVSIDTLIAKSL